MEIESRIVTTDQTLSLLSEILPQLKTERVSLGNCLGRTLAVDVVADIDQPPFNKSAMDGFACRIVDLPGPLTIVSEIAAGGIAATKVEKGNCYRIFTGAPVPEGADCVIMQEYTSVRDGRVTFTAEETKPNICYQGEDLRAGATAIKAGTLLQPHHVAIMAGFGITAPLVTAPVKVAIICSGSELVEPEIKPGNAKIRNSNAYQLSAQVSAMGAVPDYLGIVPDNRDDLIQLVTKSAGNYDVLLITGGASVGAYDLVPGVFASMGATIHFNGLNIQPGKPLVFASFENTYMIGLSGNPVSSFLQFHLVVKPLLQRLAGCNSLYHKVIKAPLSAGIRRKKSSRQQFIPVSFLPSGYANPIIFNGSAHLSALNGTDGFAILDSGISEISENQLVKILII